ncbi:MAG: M13 family metallopeptidase [Elusimicrobia bacterium]|nr:M13 family metallopeptidase [Elusimicrobiota bacterium]
MKLSLAAALAAFIPLAAQAQGTPNAVSNKDLCSYLLDVQAVSKTDCAQALKDPAAAAQARAQAPERKQDVLALAKRLSSASEFSMVNAVLSDPSVKLNPPLNPRTFAAWLGSAAAAQDVKNVSAYLNGIAAQVAASHLDKKTLLKRFEPQLALLSGALADPSAAAAAFDGSAARSGAVSVAVAASARLGASASAASLAPAQSGASSQSGASKTPPAPQPQASPITSPNPNWDAIVNPAINPCTNFYQYACSKWNAAHPIPADQSSWGTFNALMLRNESDMRQVLEAAASHPNPKDPDQAKLGNFYAACMDQKAANAAGAKPLKPELDRIAALTGKSQLAEEAAHLQNIGVGALFSFGANPDDKNSSKQIAVLDQGGYTLPERGYYLSGDFAQTRKAYESHVRKMFVLLGDTPKQAAAEEASVMAIETALAQASMDDVSRRNPANVYHMEKLSAFEKGASAFDWKAYLSGVKAPSFSKVNVADTGFFQGLNTLIGYEPLSAWKSYLRWQVVNSFAGLLSKDFVDESFNFNGRVLSGAQKMGPRWKRCVSMADSMMGDALGRAYVDKFFPPASMAAAGGMVHAEEASMARNIRGVTWMSAKTKAAALKKLSEMQNKIGYPSKWQSYAKLSISRGDLVGDVENASAFAMAQSVDEIGQKTDTSKWGMTPPMVNAYYNPSQNNINFPAGILQPPFFNAKSCLAENLGGIGAVIGHEMTHGFDDQGSQYDGHGNRRNWWTPKDKAAFDKRTQCLVNEYSQFVATQDPGNPKKPVMVSGRLTLGENTADNGGVRIAYMTLQNALNQHQAARCQSGRWTDDQVFFLSFARLWCGSDTPQLAKMLANTDPHSPNAARVNGVLRNMPQFQQAFSCPANSPMVAGAKACRVW